MKRLQGKFELPIKSIQKLAFTLAEMLIVLGIVGVIAEITIPNLVKSVNSEQYKGQWKKTYSTISQATYNIKNDYKGSLVGLFTDYATIVSLYSGEMKVVKTCTSGSCDSGNGWTTTYYMVLIDGTVLMGNSIDSTCAAASWTTNYGQSMCIDFYVDLNGTKKPNTAGQDIVWVGINSIGKIIPAGVAGMVTADWKCTSGDYCNSFLYLNQ